MISIIVPVYNAEKYLCQCIESVLEQTYKNWELLLVNDGSKDRSLSMCLEYSKKDSRIKTINKLNGGVSSARNTGIENAQGMWITFLDSDDWLEKEALEIYSETIQKTNPDIVKTGYKCHTAHKVEEYSIKTQITVYDKSILMSYLQTTHYYGFVWNSLYKKDLILRLRFDESISWLEDQFFSYECFLRGAKVTLLPHMVYNYRIHESGSLSCVNNPFTIAYSANKDIHYKREMLGDRHKLTLAECWHTYHQWLTRAINLLYTGTYSYKQRKEFYSLYKPIDGRLFFAEEKQFYGGQYPFLLKDVLNRVRRRLRLILK